MAALRWLPPNLERTILFGLAQEKLGQMCRRRSPGMQLADGILGAFGRGRDRAQAIVSIDPADASDALELARRVLGHGGVIVIAALPDDDIRAALTTAGFAVTDGITDGEVQLIRATRGRSSKPLLVHGLASSEAEAARAEARLKWPLSFLSGFPGVRSGIEGGRWHPDGDEMDKILLLYRQIPIPDRDLALMQKAGSYGYTIVLDIDDDPSFWPEFDDHDGFAFRSVHAVQVSSPEIANRLAGRHPKIQIIPNRLAFLGSGLIRALGPLRLFIGARNREADAQAWLADLQDEIPGIDAEITVVNDKAFFDAWPGDRKTYEAECSYGRYKDLLNSADIALLPLRDTPFNRCKSPLKFLECAGAGTVVIASPTVYGEVIQDGVTGFLAEDGRAVARIIRRLTDDRALLKRVAAAAREWASAEQMLADHAAERLDWYRELAAGRAEHEVERLKRCPELAIS